MPFQSEKQRRFLHANHPEIAKRWEKEYATGGLSNHFRRRFFTGALADTQGPAGGQAMSPGTSTTGGTRHGGGGGNGGTGGNGHHPPVYTGPTPEEIAAQKAADEARLQAQEDARRRQVYEDTIGRRKKKKEKVDWVDKTLETADSAYKLKNIIDNPLNPLNLYKMNPYILGGSIIKGLYDRKKKKNIETSALDVDENIKVAKLSVKQIKEYKALDLKNKMNESGVGPPLTNEEKKELERLEIEKESKLTTDSGTMIGAKGGVARKNYFHGGILDINESEEIISDDGNDIELTDYNAAFDDPNDLSTGVKSLFRAKDGGTPQLAQKSKSGKRPGYAGNPFGYSDTPAHHGDVAHGDQGRFNQPSAPVQTQTVTAPQDGGSDARETYIQTQYTSPEAIAAKNRRDIRDDIERREKEKYDTFELKVQDKWSGTYSGTIKKNQALVNNARSQWEKVKDSMNEKYKKKVGQKIIQGLLMGGVSFGIGDVIGMMVDGYKTNKAKQEFIGIINDTIAEYTKLGIPEHSPHTDTLIQTLNQEILDLTQKGDQDDIERNEFIYKPLTGEVGEEYAQGDYDSDTNAQAQWANWNAMKQKQLLNAQKQEQWRAEKEAYDQSFLVANSGGLANLFRVKNQ